MIIRIVKMTFDPDRTLEFQQFFHGYSPLIKKFEGCLHVELLRCTVTPEVYFTVSHWASEKHLEDYRQSDLFRASWQKTKKLFRSKAEAWSTVAVLPTTEY